MFCRSKVTAFTSSFELDPGHLQSIDLEYRQQTCPKCQQKGLSNKRHATSGCEKNQSIIIKLIIKSARQISPQKSKTPPYQAWNILTDPLITATDFLGATAPLPRLAELPKLRRKRSRALRCLIDRRRRKVAPKEPGDFLDAMLKAQKTSGFGDDLMIETLVSLTTAGISTVSTALEWLLLLLASDRKVQEKARAGGEYLDACILEALRLKTPLFIPRRCLQDMQAPSR